MKFHELNKRESQILTILYQIGEGSVQDVLDRMEDAPSYNSVRVMMYLLANKGFLAHRKEGVRYIYRAKRPKNDAGNSALDHILKTFFEGSVPKLMNSLIAADARDLSREDLDELARLIEQKKKEEEGK